MARLAWETILDSSKFRVYQEFEVPAGQTQSLLIRFPDDLPNEQWAYGISIETAQAVGSSFVIDATTILTVEDEGTQIFNVSPVNALHGVNPRTCAFIDAQYTFLQIPGLPGPFRTRIGSASGQSQFLPFSQEGRPLAIITADLDLVFDIENTGNSTGTYFISVLMDEVKLPASDFQT